MPTSETYPAPLKSPQYRLSPAACAPPPSGSRPRCMAMGTTASCRSSSISPGRRASRPISAKGRTAGRPCTGSMPPGSIGWRSSAAPSAARSWPWRKREFLQADRRAHRPAARCARRLALTGRSNRAFRLVRHVRRLRRPDLEQAYPRTARLAAATARPPRRYRPSRLFRWVA